MTSTTYTLCQPYNLSKRDRIDPRFNRHYGS